MRASSRTILDDAERDEDADVVDALDFDADPDADAIPATWTADHLAKRLVEAFATLARLPAERGPRKPGNHWPPHVYEWADRLAQEEQSEKEKARRRRVRNVARITPTGEDIRRMDLMLGWLSDLARSQPDHARILQRWARMRSLGRSISEDCRLNGQSRMTFYRLQVEAITALLTLLARLDAAPVW